MLDQPASILIVLRSKSLQSEKMNKMTNKIYVSNCSQKNKKKEYAASRFQFLEKVSRKRGKRKSGGGLMEWCRDEMLYVTGMLERIINNICFFIIYK